MVSRCIAAGAALVISVTIAGNAAAQDEIEPAYEDRALERLASPELQTFESERDFSRYLRETSRIYRDRHPRRSRRYYSDADDGQPQIVVAQADLECLDPDACPEVDTPIVVTGSRVQSSPAMSTPIAVTTVEGTSESESITNNQVAAVDEGDIVKRIGDYLLVLQDGRIFTIHFPTMRLTDRIDVYRTDEDGDPLGADWYDEMLVEGDQVIITAYSYEDDASEISVFRLDRESGTVERRGVFLISSDDYYDIDNYATRVVGDQLVIYTPYQANQLLSRRNRPVVRRWQPGEDWEEAIENGRRLLNSRDIYRPVFGVEEPVVHTVSICPLGDVTERGLNCRSTAIVGTEFAEMFVSPEYVYLWLPAISYNDWRRGFEGKVIERPDAEDVSPAAIFRIPVGWGDPMVLGTRGLIFDQFSMDEYDGRFRALISWRPQGTGVPADYGEVALMDVSRGQFNYSYRAPGNSRFTELPDMNTRVLENRFAGDWLVYGGRDRWGGFPIPYNRDDEDEANQIDFTSAIAVPLDRTEEAVEVGQMHDVIRIERLGNDIVINGYRDEAGLNVTYLDLDETAQIASSVQLAKRYESEGRSHAFNGTINRDGSGMIGIPTVHVPGDAGRYWWRSRTSDLSYMTFDPNGFLADAGFLPGKTEDETMVYDKYTCEVSCIDWYGNTRPFFMNGFVFGLMGTELVEAELVDGRVRTRRRLDLTGPVTH